MAEAEREPIGETLSQRDDDLDEQVEDEEEPVVVDELGELEEVLAAADEQLKGGI